MKKISYCSEKRTLLEGCDWPVGNITSKLTTNRRTSQKRKFVSEMESECGVATKKQWGDLDLVF